MDRPSRCVATAQRTTIRGVTAPKPPRCKSRGKRCSLPSSGCTVHAQGIKSWGGAFIWDEFCLAPPTAVANIFGPSTNVCFADKDETALAVLACVAGVSDKSKPGDFVN